MERLVAATVTHATDRSGIEIVATNGKPAVPLAGCRAVGNVYAVPAALGTQPGFAPGVAGRAGFTGMKVAAYVPRRQSEQATNRSKEMGVVLAYAATLGEGLRCVVFDRGRTFFPNDGFANGAAKIEQGAGIGDALFSPARCQRSYGFVGFAEVGWGKECQR